MALAGYNASVTVATGASLTYATVDGVISASLDDGREMLDITDLADSSTRRRIVGLRDLSISIDGDLETGDTGMGRLIACYRAGSIAYVQFLVDGTNGVMVPCVIENKNVSASVDGKVEVSFSLQSEGSIDPVNIGTGA